MNEIELESIWNELSAFREQERLENTEQNISTECCKVRDNLVKYSDGTTCMVCGIMVSGNLDNTGFSDQHSILVEGMTSSFSKHPLSKKLMMTNYRINSGNKKFQKQKNDWELKCYLLERIQSSQAGIHEPVVVSSISLFRMFESKPGKNGEKTIVRRNVRSSIISACLYLACKKHGVFRTPSEIAEIMSVEKSLVIKGCKLLREKIFIKNNIELVVDISQILSRVCSDLSLPRVFQTETIKMYSEVSKIIELKNYDPRILGAALLYLVCLENEESKCIKKDITIALNISEVSITRLLNIIHKI